ncbi:MAG TPA: lantibiotic dehydratase [Pyrinomonadaceae bacterium]|jgi:hypothetical protein
MTAKPTEDAAPARALTAEARAPAAPDRAETSLPEHLIGLPGGNWALWRSVALRGSGFPVADVLKLSAPACAAAADELLRAEEEVRRTRSEAITALRADAERAADAESAARLDKIVRRLQKGKPSPAVLPDTPARASLEGYNAARSALERARADYRAEYGSATASLAGPLREIAGSKRFREALIWQNHDAYRTAVRRMLQAPSGGPSRDSRQRQHEELIANYLQRYCVKNDTIGFFGPVGWARLTDEGEALRVRAGDGLLAERNVRFEAWCIDALVDKYFDRDAVIPWIRPRLAPYLYLEGTSLLLPQGPPAAVTPEQAAVLSRCDGVRTAKEIAAEVIAVPGIQIETAEEVYLFLSALREQKIVLLDLAVPCPFRLNVEESLKEFCARVEEERLRRPFLDALGEMEAAREAVRAAAGDPDRLDDALGRLEATFKRLTGADAKRADGRMYAARTLVYEDCRRDIDVELGPDFLESLGRPLSLLLTTARWFTHETALLYRKTFDEVYEELAARTGSPVVAATSVWQRVRGIVLEESQSLALEVLPTLQERWAAILDLKPGQRRADYTSEELRERVGAAFGAPRAGWKGARYNSPDVMIAAESAEAVRRGDYRLVLGEMHTAGITVSNWIFVAQHPSPGELFDARARDLPDPVVHPVIPKDQTGVTARTTLALVSPHDLFLEFNLGPSDVPRARSLSIGELTVERGPDGLQVRTRDGRRQFDVVEFIGGALTGLVMNAMKLIKPDAHTPRVTIDRLVVHRETWVLSAAEMSFAAEKDEAERFVAARRWALHHGMPRFVFVKAKNEVKPLFIDFDSPTYVNIFAKLVRRAAALDDSPTMTISEMLPTADQTWLPDSRGAHYTSELRLVALDLQQ